MGVVHKLKPELREYILAEKKAKPVLSCRGLMVLIEQKFQLKVSKSTINSLFKESGLSMPVGRTRKKRRRKPQIPPLLLLETQEKKLLEAPLERVVEVEEPVEALKEAPIEQPLETPVMEPELEELPLEMPCTGAILFKVADYLIGGSTQITELIKNQLKPEEKDLLAKIESLIYRSLFNRAEEKNLDKLWTMVKELPLDIFGAISHLFKEVAGIKITLSNGAVFYLDAQLHTVWSTPHIPADFFSTIYNIKSYINKYFKEAQPFILFSIPGYETPTQEFFDFILSLEAAEKSPSKLTFYDPKLKEIESISLGLPEKRFFVFGLWPWQFGQYRSVKSMGQFGQFYFEPLKEDFYLAEIEVELLQPNINKRVILKGCALKTELNEKIRLIILSNLGERITLQELASLYLSHWPNLEEGFQDFSHKIELSTYARSTQSFFSQAHLNFNIESGLDINRVFDYYLKVLDMYFRRCFLPLGYENKDFSTMKEQFYNLPAHLQKQKDYILVTFNPPTGWPFLKDLEYALRRINEREILFSDGKRLWCSL